MLEPLFLVIFVDVVSVDDVFFHGVHVCDCLQIVCCLFEGFDLIMYYDCKDIFFFADIVHGFLIFAFFNIVILALLFCVGRAAAGVAVFSYVVSGGVLEVRLN